jgi:hypothetical protein
VTKPDAPAPEPPAPAPEPPPIEEASSPPPADPPLPPASAPPSPPPAGSPEAPAEAPVIAVPDVPNDVTTPLVMTVLVETPADVALPGADSLPLTSLVEARGSSGMAVLAETVSTESAAFASVFEVEATELGEASSDAPEGGATGTTSAAAPLPGQASGAGRPRQAVAQAVSPVVPVVAGLVGQIQNSTYQSGSATPGLGSGAVTGTAPFMP